MFRRKLFPIEKSDCAPEFAPEKWNGALCLFNNCLAYAMDDCRKREHGIDPDPSWTERFEAGLRFPYPGGRFGVTPADVRAMDNAGQLVAWAEMEGMLAAPQPGARPGYYLVAMALSPAEGNRKLGQAHWFRQDADGLWSHKPGYLPACREDFGGRVIKDPRTCDRGIYAIFVTFFHVPAGGIRVEPLTRGRKGVNAS